MVGYPELALGLAKFAPWLLLLRQGKAKLLFTPRELVPSSEPWQRCTLPLVGPLLDAVARRSLTCAGDDTPAWSPGRGKIALGDFGRLAAGVSVPAISCLPRQGAAEGGDQLLCRSHAGIGERNGQRLAIQVILVLGNLQSMKSSQGDRAAES